MKRRGWSIWGVNQLKLSNSTRNYTIKLSDENLLRLMIHHFKLWTSPRHPNVLILKSSELFEGHIGDKLHTFLHRYKPRPLTGFPIPYVDPKTTSDAKVSLELSQLFSKYAKDIYTINTAEF